MLRKARKDAAGGLHHIIVRGIERRKIFREDEDPVNFKRVVERVAKVFGIERKDVVRPDKQPQTVKARSLLCFWLHGFIKKDQKLPLKDKNLAKQRLAKLRGTL